MAAALTTLERAIERLARDLDAIGARWAVVGGLAVSARAEPRLTRDVDVAVATEGDAHAERTVAAMVSRGHRVATVLEHVPTGRLSTVRLTLAGRTAVVGDLLFASSGIEDILVADATPVAITRTRSLQVATTGHLLALKLLSEADDRPRDREDLLALRAVAGAADLDAARAACREINARGFGRGKDLEAALDALVAR